MDRCPPGPVGRSIPGLCPLKHRAIDRMPRGEENRLRSRMKLTARLVSLGLCACAVFTPAAGASERPAVTHGVVVGDVGPSSALLWTRADRQATVHVRLSGGPHRQVAAV